jgi:hypothetical protein
MLGSKSASSANGKGELGTSQAASDRFRTPLGVRSIASDQSTDEHFGRLLRDIGWHGFHARMHPIRRFWRWIEVQIIQDVSKENAL